MDARTTATLPRLRRQANANVTQEVGVSVHKGKVREQNEDSVAALNLSQTRGTECCQSIGVYAVADGMGGHDAGEVASELAVQTAIRSLVDDVTDADPEKPEAYTQWLKRAVQLANQIVRSQAGDMQKNMGTTLVLAVVVGSDAHIVNVGDSRAYLIRGNSIQQITKDHSYVQALLDAGAIKPEQAGKSVPRNLLMQAIGTADNLKIDHFKASLTEDDWLLLCSDGLWDMLSDTEICRIVRNADSPQAAAQALVDASNAAGGHDNVAVVLVRLCQAS